MLNPHRDVFFERNSVGQEEPIGGGIIVVRIRQISRVLPWVGKVNNPFENTSHH